MNDIFNKGITYNLIDFSPKEKENNGERETLSKSNTKSPYPGNPQIVATNGHSIVIQRGEKYYAVIKIGQSIKDVHHWYDNKLLSSLLTKGDYILLDEPESYDEPKADESIEKSHVLHKERLIQRRVPVRGANGKVTYRMQWVKASEEPKKERHHSHPEEEHIRPMHHSDDTVEDYKHEHSKDDDPITPVSDDESDEHFSRETPKPEGRRYPSEHLPKKQIRGSEDYIKDMKYYGIPEELEPYMKQLSMENISYSDTNHDGFIVALEGMCNIARLHSHITNKLIKDDIENSDSLLVAKNVQKRTLKITGDRYYDDTPFVILGAHPGILRHALDRVLGKDFANELRGHLSKSNITINTYTDALDDIMKYGYRACTLEDYAQKNLKPENYEKLLETYEMENTNDAIDSIRDLSDEVSTMKEKKAIYAIADRAQAEYEAMGIGLEDPKPCYIAYNPMGGELGGAPDYGDGGVLDVSNEVLKDCTLNTDDTFIKTEPIPKVYDSEHLKDLMILKIAIKDSRTNPDDYSIFQDSKGRIDKDCLKPGGLTGLIPLELQYHNPVVKPEHLTVYNSKIDYSMFE